MTQQADPICLGERRPCFKSGRLAAVAEMQTQKSYSAPVPKSGATETEKLFWLEKSKWNANSKATLLQLQRLQLLKSYSGMKKIV